jgi:hypothetical protein
MAEPRGASTGRGSTGRSSRSSTAKKSSPAKKSSATKTSTAAKKSRPAKKSAAAKKSSEAAESRSAAAASSRGPTASDVALQAASQLQELTGRQVEGVTGLQRTDEGWQVQVEVVEVRRIPDTTDMLALYLVDTDDGGAMVGYRRVRRYVRGASVEE